MAHMRNQRQVLGGAIRRIREATGLTLQDLANRADIDIGYLSRIECGHKQPSPAVTAKLANALSIDVDDISYNVSLYVVDDMAGDVESASA